MKESNPPQKAPVTAIIVNYNTRDLLRACLASLQTGDIIPEHSIVVDNASTDDSVEMVAREFPGVEIIKSAKNIGFARANNLGLARTHTPYAWLLNSDTEIGAYTLTELTEAMETNPELGAASPPLVYRDGKPQPAHGSFPGPLNVFLWLVPIHKLLPRFMWGWINLMVGGDAVEYVSGAAIFLRVKAVRDAGGFDEQYFMYFEETDLCKKLANNHWKIQLIHASPVMHIGGGSFKSARARARLKLFVTSLKLFINKHNRGFSRFVMLTEINLLSHISIFIKSL